MHDVTGWAAQHPGDTPQPWTFARRDPGAHDVAVRITYCGLCATDLHTWGHGDPGLFPLVAGHEMVGEVTAVGSGASAHRVGDAVAIGNIVDSCRVCPECRAGRENDCRRFPTMTYAGVDQVSGGVTQGGFSSELVAHEDFVYPLPAGLDPAGVAPLLCAGVTTWAPLRRFGAGPGRTVGVIGVGGLGHLAIKFAHALGAETVALTSTAAKADDARALGADDVVVTREDRALDKQQRRFDLIVDTTGAPLALEPYLGALAVDGTYVLAGIPTQPLAIDPMALIVGEKRVAGTGSLGRPGTREMLEFCGAHGLTADVEVVAIDRLPEAMDRLARGDVRFRFSMDLSA